jgi:hypothetical protein
LASTIASTVPLTTKAAGSTTATGSGGIGSGSGSGGSESPVTNILQRDFSGTSNVYSPYLYYGRENFAPVNLYDDTYAKY